MYDVRENEHQEMLHPGVDPFRPIPIHIPSPIGKLGYYIFVRVPASAVSQLANVAVKLDIDGLREEHLTIQADAHMSVVPVPDGELAWIRLCQAMVSRGDGTLEFIGWPRNVDRTDVLLCTWPRFVESGAGR
jgi:hypothetical protein